MANADTREEVEAAVKSLSIKDRATLKGWVMQGHMSRSRLLEVYDRVRVLAKEDQEIIVASIRD